MIDHLNLSDRQWSILAHEHVTQAMAHVGDLNTRYNALVQDNRTLLREIDKANDRIKNLEESLSLLADLVMRETK